tara:strand:- start:632 stop:1714 length:1083 start_codon:yes stop_codon:yes gene_type:complete
MGQAQDLVGGPRFGAYDVGRPRPQDISTFNPDFGQIDTTALMNMLKELANQAPITPEPVVTPPAPVITSPGPDSGPRDSIVTTPQVITDTAPDEVKFNVVKDHLGNWRVGKAPQPVEVSSEVSLDPILSSPGPDAGPRDSVVKQPQLLTDAPTPTPVVAPAPIVRPLPPAPEPVASPKDMVVSQPQILTDAPSAQTIQQQALAELTNNIADKIIPAQPGGTFIPNPPEAGIDPVIEEAIKAYVEAPKGPMLRSEYLNTATTATPLPIGININNAFPPALTQEVLSAVPVVAPTPVVAPVVTPPIPTPTVSGSLIPTVSDAVKKKSKRTIGGSGVFQDTGLSFGGGGSTVKVDAPIYRFRH